jgi:predicted XRE-type DNA-binding protein
MKTENIAFHEGSGNVFADFGHQNPDEAQLKSRLALRIYRAMNEKGLTQRQAAALMGVDHAKVSAIVNGRLTGYSIDRLFRFLNALDVNDEIKLDRMPAQEEHATTRVV